MSDYYRINMSIFMKIVVRVGSLYEDQGLIWGVWCSLCTVGC